MINQFENLKPPEAEVPEELRAEVFSSLDMLLVLADVIDLFTSQFVLSGAELGATMVNNNFEEEEIARSN